MINNSSFKISKGVKINDAPKVLEDDKKTYKLDRDKNKIFLSNQYSIYRGFKNVRYSSYGNKFSFDNRQRDDYRMARGSYTRKPTRVVNKREFDTPYNPRRKFQDSTKDFSGTEDTRISKTLRRMVREDDPDVFSSLCIQLQESILVVENERYIRKAMEFICESILDMLHSGPCYETKLMAAKCLSHLAVALECDAKRFFDWIFTKYFEERNLEVRALLMKSILYMLELDKDHVLGEFAGILVGHIQNILENAEVHDLVLLTGKICNVLMEEYIEVFSDFFKDTVDILVGWHIDIEQSQSVIRIMSSCLNSLAPYWISDLGFTVSLLGQLLEDMERYANDYRQICADYATLDLEEDNGSIIKEHHSLKMDSLRCLAKTMSFMKVFNSITKTVGQYLSPATSPTLVSWNFLVDSLNKVVRTLLLCLETENVDEELIITGNECAWLLISLMQCKLNPGQVSLCKLIEVQLENTLSYDNNTLASMLQLISKVVKEGSANLPEDLIKTLIGSDSNILKLRFSTNVEVHRGIVAVYQSLLNLKNIPLLQEAYKFVLGDMEKAYLALDSSSTTFCTENPHIDNPQYTPQMAQAVLLFHLKALSDLANASSSIIGMWVLQPCILELLAVKLQPTKAAISPSIRYALLFLLYSHCLRYSNFISSSDLVTSVQGRTNVCDLLRIMGSDITPTSSPTSGHLTVILNLLTQLLKMDLDAECTMLVLKWCGMLLNNAQVYLSSLLITKEFVEMMNALIQFGCNSTDHYAIERVLDNLLIFLLNPNNWDSKPNLLLNIAEVCFIQINSINPSIRQKCKSVLIKLPWSTVLTVLRTISQKHKGPFNHMLSTYRTHMSRGTNGEVQSQHFKLFLSYILDRNSSETPVTTFMDSFYNCWNSSETKSEFEKVVPCFESGLFFWETWECAQYCVVNKLRTTLGKPQDTFMAIEGALKNLARETTRKHGEIESGFSLRRVRLLLEFVEQLEKSIYNASDGTAAALLAPPKPVRTFFHTNKSTCGEWLARIRLILVMVSVHVGLSTTAVRHGYCLLQDMVHAGNTKNSDFENAIMYVSWALYSLNESEAIEGLYAWCNDSLNISFPFLKALSDQAASRYESALENYLRLVDEVDSDSLNLRTSELSLTDTMRGNECVSDFLRSFIADQITECYLDLNDWTQLKEWKKKEADFLSVINGNSIQRYSHVTVKEANMYCDIDVGNFSGVNLLVDWTDFSGTNKNVQSGWNMRHLLTQTKQNLLEKLLVVHVDEEDNERDAVTVSEFMNAIENFLLEDVKNLPSPLIEDFATLLFVASSYFTDSKTSLNNFIMDINGKKLGSKRLGDALFWTKIIEKYRKCNLNMDRQINLSELYLQLIKSARKEGNMHLASRQLLNHFEKVFNALGSMKNLDNGRKPYNILLETITNQSTAATAAIWSVDNTDALLELSKLAYRYNNEELAIEICAMTALGITHAGGIADPFIRDKTSHLLLKLAKWLSSDLVCSDSALPFPSYPTIQKLNTLLKHNINPVNNSPSFEIMSYDFSTSVIPEKDATVGNLLRISVVQSPTLAKSWNRFGNWCYKWGRTVVDKQNNILTTADKLIIDSLIPPEVTNKEDVYSILTRIKPPVDEEDIEADNVNTTELIEWQLRSTGQFSDEQMSGLIEIWQNTHARIYAYYHLAAQAYFKYLQMSDFKENGAETVTATLRLLRLIVKYSLELQSVFEVELPYTPTTPWKCIIPQLFSRLSHPEPYVRRRISELLSRLAEDAPHLITFPAVVGSDSGATGTINNMPTSKLFKSCLPSETEVDPAVIQDEDELDDEDDDEVSQDDQGHILENCYLAMVDSLAKQVPDTIFQVQLLVSELRRITLLWDELWLGALTQHYSDMARRVNQLSMEITRIDANRHLTDAEKDSFVMEKYLILMRPLLFILEQLEAITSVKPETPHEQWFQKTFGENIRNTINTLQNPKDPRKPQDAWKAVKLLQCQFQRKAYKRTSYSLKMSDISPALAALKNTSIAMPGVEHYITIAAVHNQISVLPTKTKPKKLVFRGSDGKMYTYLFKGLEDLHLDERIMQFLSIANTMLKESGYQARHYSVIPLGPRSGLISWVDHVTPIFAVYKRWQQREAMMNSQNTVMRPSDLFYAKLTPLLKECGIANLDNRKEWPLNVLVQVLTMLMKETPDNLLAKELWCQSVNAGAWWKSLKLYSTSLAVMSVIGYIIGLGDRHLDNVLVHLTTGEVVHIDYNVCFEKGKTLRVPEKVPFRMTPNLKTALGVTGVEGIFRLTCERVMEVLKTGKETLLTLLEAFVYDPLIDWTPGIETGYTGAVYGGGRAVALKNKQSRKQLEQEVTTSMFTIRLAEIKADWFENRDKVSTAVSELCSNIEKWIETEKNLNNVMDGLAKGSQQLEVLKAAAAHPQHHLYTLHSRYQSRKDASDAMFKAQFGLKQKLEECDTQLTQYKMLFYHLRGEQLSKWSSDLNNRKDCEHKLFDVIADFLKSTGMNQLVSQCVQSETELDEAIRKQIPYTITCLDLLKKYSMIISLYPASSSLKHRCASYKRWIHTMTDFPSPSVCDTVLSEFNLLYMISLNNDDVAQQAVKFSENMHQRIVDVEYALKTRLEKLEKMNVEDESNILQMEQTIEKMSTNSALTLQCSVINELCQLNKRFLKMETAALGAGNCLMVLTTMDGEWFLDDMCLMTEVSIKLASYILSPTLLENNPSIHLVTKCLDLLHGIYKRLQELNVNFSTIIIPETMKKLLVEDETVLEIISKLNLIISSCSLPLPELIKELQTHLRYMIMGMPSPHPNCVAIATELRCNFSSLINERNNSLSGAMTEGQMLLMGFNVLFNNIFKSTADLFSLLPALAMTNTTWNSIDLIKDTRSLIGPVFNKESQALLQDLFLIKYIHTMHEFFRKCQMTAAAYRGGLNMPTVYHSDEELNKLIKKFTADYLSQQLLGLFSYTFATTIGLFLQHLGFNIIAEVEQRDIGAESKVPMEDLVQKAIEQQRQREVISSGSYSHAISILNNLQVAWKRMAINKKLNLEIKSHEVMIQNLKLQYTVHHWLHDDARNLKTLPAPLIDRSEFMIEIKLALTELINNQVRIAELKEQQESLITSARTRLKWAAGSNPALNEVMNSFEENLKTENDLFTHDHQIATTIINMCTCLLQYESLRVRTSDSVLNDTQFVKLVNSYKEACNMVMCLATATFTPEEENLIQLLPPTSPIDSDWINQADALISKSIKELNQELEPLKNYVGDARDEVKSMATSLRVLLSEHHKTLVDARSLLKSMMKFEENEEFLGIPDYLLRHKSFCEQLNSITKELSSTELTEVKGQVILKQLELIQQQIDYIYEELFKFAIGKQPAKAKRPPLLRQESIHLSPKKRLSHDPRTGKILQEKNEYAVNVWRRVRMKLEGRDSDHGEGRKLSVQEQVDKIIKDSTNIENLALLYEGWTPWV